MMLQYSGSRIAYQYPGKINQKSAQAILTFFHIEGGQYKTAALKFTPGQNIRTVWNNIKLDILLLCSIRKNPIKMYKAIFFICLVAFVMLVYTYNLAWLKEILLRKTPYYKLNNICNNISQPITAYACIILYGLLKKC